MNARTEPKTSVIVYAVAIVGVFMIMGVLAWMLRHYTQPLTIDAGRAEARRKALVELRQSAQDQLNGYGYVDVGRGQVRLPVDQAIEMMILQWKDPAVGRSNLLGRLSQFNPEKATSFE